MRLAALKILLLLVIASSAFFSCGGRAASGDLERASLFEIPYGRFDGEIDLFSNVAGLTGGVCPEVCLYMRDGLFYVGNAASKKVLQFTSYGDLLSVYYNPDIARRLTFTQALRRAAHLPLARRKAKAPR